MTQMWTDLLKIKSYHDLTGNGVNHPNDFAHRIYANVLLEMLTDLDAGAEQPPAQYVASAPTVRQSVRHEINRNGNITMKKSWNTWNVRSVLSHVHLGRLAGIDCDT